MRPWRQDCELSPVLIDTPLKVGKTYHLAGTVSAGIMTLYVNGEQVSQVADVTTIESRDSPLHVWAAG
jgi:hypothetical protein